MDSSINMAAIFLNAMLLGALVLLPSEAFTAPSKAELNGISARGRLLAEYDKAAAQASDEVTAVHPVDGLVDQYIARKTPTGWIVDFGRLNVKENAFSVAYEATAVGEANRFRVTSLDPVREDTGWDLSAARAIESALANFGKASRPYNAAVLPARSGELYVYLYPAQTEEGAYPLGADVRYLMTENGTIIGKRRLHESIVESKTNGNNGKVSGGFHTHVLSDSPEDTDVLLVLMRRPLVPEVVVTKSYEFVIGTDGSIAMSSRR